LHRHARSHGHHHDADRHHYIAEEGHCLTLSGVTCLIGDLFNCDFLVHAPRESAQPPHLGAGLNISAAEDGGKGGPADGALPLGFLDNLEVYPHPLADALHTEPMLALLGYGLSKWQLT
jgi:hypothetical protein